MTLTGVQTSWDLVRAAQAGNMNAYGELWHRYRYRVRGFIRQRLPWTLRDNGLEDDLTSEVFTRALKALPSWTEQGYDVSRPLFTIASNLVIDRYSDKSVRHRYEVLWDSRIRGANQQLHDPDSFNTWSDYLDGVTDPQPSHEDSACDTVTIWPIVAALSPRWLEYIMLRYVMELTSSDEIGARMGLSNSAVKSIGVRVRAELKKTLKVAA